ncbi:hypothetical protein STENM223S_05358 [Streptomyces tendae]
MPPFCSVQRYTRVPSASLPNGSRTGLARPADEACAVPPQAVAATTAAAAPAITVRLFSSISAAPSEGRGPAVRRGPG